MKTIIATTKILQLVFWSLVYACLIIYTARIFWRMLKQLKSGIPSQSFKVDAELTRTIDGEYRDHR